MFVRQENDYIINPTTKHLDTTNILSQLKHRVTWAQPKTELPNVISVASGLGGANTSTTYSAAVNPEDTYVEEPIQETPELLEWKFYVDEPLRLASNNHALLNSQTPYEIWRQGAKVSSEKIPTTFFTPPFLNSEDTFTLTLNGANHTPTSEPYSKQSCNSEPYSKQSCNSIKLDTDCINVTSDNIKTEPFEDQPKVYARFAREPLDAIILMPTFTCPVMANPNQKEPIKLLLLFDDIHEHILNSINNTFFLSIHFNDKLKSNPHFSEYNFSTPWVIPVYLSFKTEKDMNDELDALRNSGDYSANKKSLRKIMGYKLNPPFYRIATYNIEMPNFDFYQNN